MGGRGASSGISKSGKPYGTEYTCVYQDGNIKFLISNDKNTKIPMETMTKDRVYVTIDKNKNKIKSISFYDDDGLRTHQIDMDHPHKIEGKFVQPHIHFGYFHNEYGDGYVGIHEQDIIDKVIHLWNNKVKRRT